MENILAWGDQYSVGNELIDNQHKKLFEMGKNILGLDVDVAKELIINLFEYAQEHFTSEEDHMQSIGFPDIDSHRAIHKKLLNELSVWLKKGIKHKKDADEVQNFFLCWLLDHVMRQDMQYFHYAQGKD